MPARLIAILVAIPLTALVIAQAPLDQDLLNTAWEGQDALVKNLLEMGADVDARDEFGQTPLMIAVSQGHMDTVRVLIEGGADVNAIDDQGQSVLSLADDDEIGGLLIESGAAIIGDLTLEAVARLLVSAIFYIAAFTYFGLFYAEHESKSKFFGLLIALGAFSLWATIFIAVYFQSAILALPGALIPRGLIGYASYYVADKKNRNCLVWILLAAVFGPLLLLIVIYLPPAKKPAGAQTTLLNLGQETPSQDAREEV
jgi:hypothetical protein